HAVLAEVEEDELGHELVPALLGREPHEEYATPGLRGQPPGPRRGRLAEEVIGLPPDEDFRVLTAGPYGGERPAFGPHRERQGGADPLLEDAGELDAHGGSLASSLRVPSLRHRGYVPRGTNFSDTEFMQ